MVLGKLPVPGRPTIRKVVGQGPIALAVGASGGCLDIFTLLYPFSSLSPSLWETARYRLKYCLKGPLNPKQPTNIFLFLFLLPFFFSFFLCCNCCCFTRILYFYMDMLDLSRIKVNVYKVRECSRCRPSKVIQFVKQTILLERNVFCPIREYTMLKGFYRPGKTTEKGSRKLFPFSKMSEKYGILHIRLKDFKINLFVLKTSHRNFATPPPLFF